MVMQNNRLLQLVAAERVQIPVRVLQLGAGKQRSPLSCRSSQVPQHQLHLVFESLESVPTHACPRIKQLQQCNTAVEMERPGCLTAAPDSSSCATQSYPGG